MKRIILIVLALLVCFGGNEAAARRRKGGRKAHRTHQTYKKRHLQGLNYDVSNSPTLRDTYIRFQRYKEGIFADPKEISAGYEGIPIETPEERFSGESARWGESQYDNPNPVYNPFGGNTILEATQGYRGEVQPWYKDDRIIIVGGCLFLLAILLEYFRDH